MSEPDPGYLHWIREIPVGCPAILAQDGVPIDEVVVVQGHYGNGTVVEVEGTTRIVGTSMQVFRLSEELVPAEAADDRHPHLRVDARMFRQFILRHVDPDQNRST